MEEACAIDAQLSVRGQLRQLLPLAVPVLAVAAQVVLSGPRRFTVVVGLLIVVIGLVGVVSSLRSPRAGVVLRLDEHGVTRKGSPTVPWSDLAEVRVGSLLPRWMGGGGGVVVGFIPRDGVELPGPPSASGRDQSFGYRQRVQRYGTNLVVPADTLSIAAADLVRYAQRVGGLPSRVESNRVPRRWFWLVLLIIGSAGLAVGLLVGLRG